MKKLKWINNSCVVLTWKLTKTIRFKFVFTCDYTFILFLAVHLYNLAEVFVLQRLPKVFNERFYNGEEYIFINGNNRRRYVCLIRLVKGEIQVYGDEWGMFVQDNVSSLVRRLHFVKDGVNTFYVTGYNADVSEGPGYDSPVVGNRVVRCLVRYMAGGQV